MYITYDSATWNYMELHKIIDNVFGTCKQKLSFLFNFVLCVAVNNKSECNKENSYLDHFIKVDIVALLIRVLISANHLVPLD